MPRKVGSKKTAIYINGIKFTKRTADWYTEHRIMANKMLAEIVKHYSKILAKEKGN